MRFEARSEHGVCVSPGLSENLDRLTLNVLRIRSNVVAALVGADDARSDYGRQRPHIHFAPDGSFAISTREHCPSPTVGRGRVGAMQWVGQYERAWRDGDLVAVAA
jgi:hypothetical protein